MQLINVAAYQRTLAACQLIVANVLLRQLMLSLTLAMNPNFSVLLHKRLQLLLLLLLQPFMAFCLELPV